jgi:hypothetical protein
VNWAVLLESAVPVVGLIIGTVALAITSLSLGERKSRKVAMCSATCSGCGWSYRGGVPAPIRCMGCGGPMTSGSGVSVTGSPSFAAHPPTPNATGGSGSSNVTHHPGGGGGSMSATPAHGRGGNGGSISGAGGGGAVVPWGSGTRHLPSGARLTPSRARSGAAGMTGFAEQGGGDFDLAVGSVHGLRQWNLTTPDFRQDPFEGRWQPTAMTGATGRFQWQPGMNEAVCNSNSNHKPPLDADEHGNACGCGFWAYWDISALATGGAMSLNLSSYVPITGVIEGSGRVLIGERGFRSQRARIVALAPAFSVQAYPPEDYGRSWSQNMPRSNVITDSGANDSYDQQLKAEQEQRDAQLRAEAWMGVIQDRLGVMYPGTKVYATLRGMLASVKLGEIS